MLVNQYFKFYYIVLITVVKLLTIQRRLENLGPLLGSNLYRSFHKSEMVTLCVARVCLTAELEVKFEQKC